MTVPSSKLFPFHPPPRYNVRRPPRMGSRTYQVQPDYPPGSKIRFCIDFVSITFGCHERLYLANVCIVAPIFFSSLVPRKLQERSCGDFSRRRLLFPGFVPEAREAVSDVFDDFLSVKRSYRARNSVRSRSMVSFSIFLSSI